MLSIAPGLVDPRIGGGPADARVDSRSYNLGGGMFGRGWAQTRATVVAAQQMGDKPVYTKHGGGTMRRRYEYALDVHPPDGGPVFRTTVLSPLNVDSLRDLAVGEVVPVLVHAKDEKVKFDTSDPSMSQAAADNARRARFDAVAHAAPDTGPRRPDLSRETLLRQREKLQAAQRAREDDTATQSDDRLDRLQKLADLHDRGALNDAEFETEKAKILDGT
jgi:Short C-terminal domain